MRTIGLSDLLAVRCMMFPKAHYTVREVIKLCANVRGGVHLGKPDEPDKAALFFDSVAAISPHPEQFNNASSFVIREVAKVVINGMQPLVLAIQAK
jgi:hypothetical protein